MKTWRRESWGARDSWHPFTALGGDLAVGVVLQAALKAGLLLQTVIFPHDTYIDIGTPEDLAKAVREFNRPEA